MDTFDLIADERRALAPIIAKLTGDQLRTPSLVPTWTVHDVAAHMALPLQVGAPRFLLALLLSRGSFERAVDRLTWGLSKKYSAAELAEIIERKAAKRFAPKSMGPAAPLTDILVHGLDLRRPLGIARVIPDDRTRIALRFLTETSAFGFKRPEWHHGLRFEATNLDWSYGTGQLVRGHSDSLLLALTGRRAALEDLEGEGVATLRARFG